MTDAHFEIVQSDAGQPWHVLIVGGNGEPVLVGENLENRDDAEAVVFTVARMFGIRQPSLAQPLTGWAREEGEEVLVDHSTGTAVDTVRVRYVDRRSGLQEPPC